MNDRLRLLHLTTVTDVLELAPQRLARLVPSFSDEVLAALFGALSVQAETEYRDSRLVRDFPEIDP